MFTSWTDGRMDGRMDEKQIERIGRGQGGRGLSSSSQVSAEGYTPELTCSRLISVRQRFDTEPAGFWDLRDYNLGF